MFGTSETFRAMGASVLVLGPPGVGRVLPAVRDLFEREEQRFSRFRDDSELALVNAGAGSPTPVSARFAEVLLLALVGARMTRGLFDPTLLQEVRAIGYDRDFDELSDELATALSRTELAPVPARRGRWREVHLHDSVLQMPADVALDFGGIAKGWTVDRAAELVEAQLGWGLVDAGGDLRVSGAAPPITVGIEDPFDGSIVASLEIERGALATSSVMRRRWGGGRHHLIDSRSGRPAHTGVVQATVWAPTCADAEVRAKAAILTGSAVLAGSKAAVVLDDGTLLTSFPASTSAVA